MSFKIKTTANFEKEAKRLSKKYHSFKKDLNPVLENISKNPRQGISLGKNCYKFRIAISSKGKGSLGGARLIAYIHIVENAVYLISVYDKSEKETVSQKELLYLISLVPL